MIFLIDKNIITYDDLINYINDNYSNEISDFENYTLSLIKNICQKKIIDIDDMLETIKSYNKEIIISTSGTTGNPKKISHTINSITKNIKINSLKNWGSVYELGKMAYYQMLFQVLFNKTTLINLNGYSIDDISERIIKYDVKSISGTPTFYKMLISLDKKFEKIEQLTLGGESSNSNLIQLLKKYFPNSKITNVYASTEGAAIISSNSDEFKISNKIKILDNILYIHKNYVNNLVSEGDWYNTGDMIEMITEDRFKIIGKKENEINISGIQVNFTKIESKITSLSYILDCHVYSRKNSVNGNIICSDIVLKNKNIEKSQIKNDLKEFLNRYEIPAIINFVDNIKINNNMKKVII